MKHVVIHRTSHLNPLDDDVRRVRNKRRGVRLVGTDGSVTMIPWAVITRMVVSRPQKVSK